LGTPSFHKEQDKSSEVEGIVKTYQFQLEISQSTKVRQLSMCDSV
jgi:hypothetical protein